MLTSGATGSGGGGGGGAVTVAEGADVVEGATTDAAVVTDTNGTISGKLRGLVKWAFERMPASLGQKSMAASLPVVIASNQSDVSIFGTVAVATTPVGQQAMNNSMPVVLASNQSSIPVTSSGTVTEANSAAIAASLSVMDDWDETDRAKVNIIAGQVGVAGGTGTDSALTQRVSLATNVALPAGANVIGHVITDTGSTTTVTGNVTAIQGTGSNLHTVIDSGSVTVIPVSLSRSDTYTVPANGVTVNAVLTPYKAYAIQVVNTGGLASLWDMRLEGSLDGTNFDQILQHTNTTGDGKIVFSGSLLAPALYFRSRCAGLTLALATNLVVTIAGIQ